MHNYTFIAGVSNSNPYEGHILTKKMSSRAALVENISLLAAKEG